MRLILFDLDGTLIDSEQGIVNSIEHSLAKLGVASPGRESLRSWIGPPLRAVFPNVVGDDRAWRPALPRALQRDRLARPHGLSRECRRGCHRRHGCAIA